MPVETLATPRDNLPNVYTNVTAREVDFVTRFNRNWDALNQLLGIMNPIRKAPGTILATYRASVELEDGAVPAGAVIPYSKSTIEKVGFEDIAIKKYASAVPIEDVAKYGARIAVQKKDEEFLNSLQTLVMSNFYAFLNTGTLTGNETTWQRALAMAKGKVLDKFQKMRKTVTDVVGFVNILDLYNWLGEREITIQTMFGLSYIKNFMGYSTLFLLSEPDIAEGTVIALPVENINLYYIDPSDSEFDQLGLTYTVEGETNLIGFHANGNYSTAVGESFAIMGMKLWAEYLDGIAVMSVGDAGDEGAGDEGAGDEVQGE